MKEKVAIIYMAHDGFTSLYTGVGTLARDFLLAFPDVETQFSKYREDVELSLYATTLKYNKTCFGYSEEVRNGTLAMTDSYPNVHLIELDNGSDGKESYGTIENWRHACMSAANFIHTLTPQYDRILVIAVDTPFAQTANYYLDEYKSDNVQFIWLPQSTVRIHGYGKSSVLDQQGKQYVNERYDWERTIIELANNHDAVAIGSAGDFLRKHLIDEYGASPTVFVDMKNSLYLPRLERNKKDQNYIEQILVAFGVPTDRPLLFSFGRAEPYKGLDYVLRNADELINNDGYYVLILASPYTKDDPYLKELDQLASKYPDDIKIVYDLDFVTPHYLMQWKHTNIIAVLSRSEPFGLIPIESRFYNNPNMALLVSNQDGLPAQVNDGKDGFITDLTDTSIKACYKKLAGLSDSDKKAISQKGYEKICDEFDQVKVNIKLLKQCLFNRKEFDDSLRQIATILSENNVTWCLGASGALYVQGVAVVPNDLDIIIDTSDAGKAREVLSSLELGTTVTLDFAGKKFQKFKINKTAFPAEAAMFDIIDDPLIKINWQGTQVSVHPLEFELEMYKQRKGKEKIVELIEFALKREATDARN